MKINNVFFEKNLSKFLPSVITASNIFGMQNNKNMTNSDNITIFTKKNHNIEFNKNSVIDKDSYFEKKIVKKNYLQSNYIEIEVEYLNTTSCIKRKTNIANLINYDLMNKNFLIENYNNFSKNIKTNIIPIIFKINNIYLGNISKFVELFILDEKDNVLFTKISIFLNKYINKYSSIFEKCRYITEIKFINNKNFKLYSLDNAFCQCDNLNRIDGLLNFDLNKVTSLKATFKSCINLKEINGECFNITENKLKDISEFFSNCKIIKELPNISTINTSNVENMENLFINCNNLMCLPDISKWNTENVLNMSNMFSHCFKLQDLPDLSKWNTSNTLQIFAMFYECHDLLYLPDISKWDTSNVKSFLGLFYNCYSLLSLPDISKWNTSNVKEMSCMFCGCYNLSILPDISKWNTYNLQFICYMFSNCRSLSVIPDLSKWNTSNLVNAMKIFNNCLSLSYFPDINICNHYLKYIDKRDCINVIEDDDKEL